MTRRRHAAGWALALLLTMTGPRSVWAQAPPMMPDPKQVSGLPLPVGDVPVGTVSVRVIRGSFANNVAGATVEFLVNGQPRPVTTDENGRAQVANLSGGTRLKAVVVVDGQRIESQDIVIGGSGIRVVLVATEPGGAAVEGAPAAVAKGAVVLGPETRVVAEFSDERLNIFYALQILNPGTAPVEIGGPFIVDLPAEARGASILPGSSAQASALGTRVAVTGPFAPGTTRVDVGYELRYSSRDIRFEQRWPVELQQVLVLVPKQGGIGFTSAQAPQRQEVSSQGVPVVVGLGPTLPAGQPLVVDISGLPLHARWPRYVALTLAGTIVTLGLWAVIMPGPRRRSA